MSKQPKPPRYLLMDARARLGDEGWMRAAVFECCDTLKDAVADAPMYGEDVVIWDTKEDCEAPA